MIHTSCIPRNIHEGIKILYDQEIMVYFIDKRIENRMRNFMDEKGMVSNM